MADTKKSKSLIDQISDKYNKAARDGYLGAKAKASADKKKQKKK